MTISELNQQKHLLKLAYKAYFDADEKLQEAIRLVEHRRTAWDAGDLATATYYFPEYNSQDYAAFTDYLKQFDMDHALHYSVVYDIVRSDDDESTA